jgi:oxalate decarboxylase/phosphoglucose isomerase-like protein (cupin superfamily)
MILPITQKELKEVLMDPQSAEIKEPYMLINQGMDGENITIITPGRNGPEFNKTIGFAHKFAGTLIYRCIYGKGVFMMQKNDGLGEVKEVIVRGLRPGVEVEIPAGYVHTIYNTGRTILVMVDNGPKDLKFQDPTAVLSKKGLAYYVVDKKGEVAFEKNSNYSYHPTITS